VVPSGGFSAASLSGTFYSGDSEVVNAGVSAEAIAVKALTSDGAGNVGIVGDYIGDYNGTSVMQASDQSDNTTIGPVNPNGTFSTSTSYGQINAIILSTTKVVSIDDATDTDPIIQVIKPISPEI
jgi:hypothetical protein